MKTIASITILLLLSTYTCAQTEKPNIKLYRAQIQTYGDTPLIRGIFYAFTDSTLILIDVRSKNEIKNQQFQTQEIPVKTVQWMKLRPEGRIWSSALVGAVVGGITGVVIGYDSGDNLVFSAEQNAGLLGGTFFCIGGGLGAAVGARSEYFEIHGKRERIIENYEQLHKYTINKKQTIQMKNNHEVDKQLTL